MTHTPADAAEKLHRDWCPSGPDCVIASCAFRREVAAIWAAQLADMPMDAIVDWLLAQGHADLARMLHGRITGVLEKDDEEGVIAVFLRGRPDRLPPGYPPCAEDDEPLPFEVGRE